MENPCLTCTLDLFEQMACCGCSKWFEWRKHSKSEQNDELFGNNKNIEKRRNNNEGN